MPQVPGMNPNNPLPMQVNIPTQQSGTTSASTNSSRPPAPPMPQLNNDVPQTNIPATVPVNNVPASPAANAIDNPAMQAALSQAVVVSSGAPNGYNFNQNSHTVGNVGGGVCVPTSIANATHMEPNQIIFFTQQSGYFMGPSYEQEGVNARNSANLAESLGLAHSTGATPEELRNSIDSGAPVVITVRHDELHGREVTGEWQEYGNHAVTVTGYEQHMTPSGETAYNYFIVDSSGTVSAPVIVSEATLLDIADNRVPLVDVPPDNPVPGVDYIPPDGKVDKPIYGLPQTETPEFQAHLQDQFNALGVDPTNIPPRIDHGELKIEAQPAVDIDIPAVDSNAPVSTAPDGMPLDSGGHPVVTVEGRRVTVDVGGTATPGVFAIYPDGFDNSSTYTATVGPSGTIEIDSSQGANLPDYQWSETVSYPYIENENGDWTTQSPHPSTSGYAPGTEMPVIDADAPEIDGYYYDDDLPQGGPPR